MRSFQRRRNSFARHRSVGFFCDITRPFTFSHRSLVAGTLLAATISTFSGCDQNTLGVVDPRGNAPVVSQFAVSPSSVRLDTIVSTGGSYAVKIVASVVVNHPDGADKILAVTANILTPDGNPLLAVALHDDGIAPDAKRGDAKYSGLVTLKLAQSDVGIYHVVFSAIDVNEREGTSAIQSLSISHHKSPPWLLNLVAPDTVVIPLHGKNPFDLSVAVGDSDGVGDVKDVTLRVTSPGSPTSILHLLDHGNIANKDSIQGEIYSITLQVDSSNTAKNYALLFQAIDRAGDTSATLVHPLVIRK